MASSDAVVWPGFVGLWLKSVPISIPGSNSWPDSIHGKNDPMSRPSVHPSDSSPQFFSTRDPFHKPCRLDSSFFKDCATNLFNHQPLRYDAWRSTANKSFWSKWTWSHFGKILYQLITEPWSPKTIPGDFISLPCHLSESVKVTKKKCNPPWFHDRFTVSDSNPMETSFSHLDKTFRIPAMKKS